MKLAKNPLTAPLSQGYTYAICRKVFETFTSFFGRDLTILFGKTCHVAVATNGIVRYDRILGYGAVSQFLIQGCPSLLRFDYSFIRRIWKNIFPFPSEILLGEEYPCGDAFVMTRDRLQTYLNCILFVVGVQEMWPKQFWKNCMEPFFTKSLKAVSNPWSDSVVVMIASAGLLYRLWDFFPRCSGRGFGSGTWGSGNGNRLGQD